MVGPTVRAMYYPGLARNIRYRFAVVPVNTYGNGLASTPTAWVIAR